MKILVLDCETTGVGPEPIGVCEIAWLELEPADGLGVVPGSEYSTLVDPQMPIPADASAINGIYDHMVEDAPTMDEVEFPEGDIILVCHNVKYDYKLVKDRINVVDSLCTYMLARRLLPDVPNHKLGTLVAHCGISPQLAHRAHGDILSVAYLLDYMSEGADMTFWQFLKWMHQPYVFSKMPFGKHRGKPMNEVPKGYLSWLIKEELDQDMVATLNHTFGRKIV